MNVGQQACFPVYIVRQLPSPHFAIDRMPQDSFLRCLDNSNNLWLVRELMFELGLLIEAQISQRLGDSGRINCSSILSSSPS